MSAHWRPGCWRDVGRGQQTHTQGLMASVFRLVQDGRIQPDSTFQTFCHFFLTNSSSSVLCAYNYIRPDLERFEQPFFFITCLLLLHPLPLLLLFLFPPLHHFHPRSAFVNSCPERECAVCTRLCVRFITFPHISDRHFLFVCFWFFFSFLLRVPPVSWFGDPGVAMGRWDATVFRPSGRRELSKSGNYPP